MGELRTRKRGKNWEYSFEGARVGGQRKPISKGGFRTKAEAVAAGTQAKAEYDNTGRSFSPRDISLADYLDYWYQNYVLQHMVYNTQQDYERKIRIHIKPALGHYRLAAIEPDAIQRWIDDKKMQGYAQSMIKNILCCLSGALNYAVYPCQYIKFNPCTYVRIPKINENKARKEYREYICCAEDYAAILQRFTPDTNFFMPLVTGYHCGTRIGETYGIDLNNDVDLVSGTVTINHQLADEGGTWFYRPPKYNSVRTLRIDEEYAAILTKEIRERKKNMLRYGPYFKKTYLLPDSSIVQAPASVSMPYPEIMPLSARENGELLTPQSFQYCARVVHTELGNPLFHSHALRHTHGTILAENGAQPKTVMERLGHRDLKVTMERYVFNTEKMQSDAVKIFAAHRAEAKLAYRLK